MKNKLKLFPSYITWFYAMQSREEFRFINNFAEIIKTVTEYLNKAHVLNFESMMQNKY